MSGDLFNSSITLIKDFLKYFRFDSTAKVFENEVKTKFLK